MSSKTFITRTLLVLALILIVEGSLLTLGISGKKNIPRTDLATDIITGYVNAEEPKESQKNIAQKDLEPRQPTDPENAQNLQGNQGSPYPQPTYREDNNQTQTNYLFYPRFGVSVPIVYSAKEDVFNPDGSYKNTNALNSTFQDKLRYGIVHLYTTPLPGEIGNSYIVGHSSNYASVSSQYNNIFKPLERASQAGDIFVIYDYQGRKLTFRVFEAFELTNVDSLQSMREAYKRFGDKRVVTLQTSIVKSPSVIDRWLTRGELIAIE